MKKNQIRIESTHNFLKVSCEAGNPALMTQHVSAAHVEAMITQGPCIFQTMYKQL